MKANRNPACFVVLLAASLLAINGCDGTLQNRDATSKDVSLFGAALKGGASPQQACQELNDLCGTTGMGCNAFDYFCGEIYDKACKKLEEVCGFFPEACDLHGQHCAGGDPGDGDPGDGDPGDGDPGDGDPGDQDPKPEEDGCCARAGKCLQEQDMGQCLQAAQVCADMYGVELQGVSPAGDFEWERIKGLYYQICRADQPHPQPEPDPTKPGDEDKDQCCALANDCIATADPSGETEVCSKAMAVCSNSINFPIPTELPEGMSYEHVKNLVNQVCGGEGDNPWPPEKPEQPDNPGLGQCCDLVQACMQEPGKCEMAVQVCAAELNLDPSQIPPGQDFQQYLPMIEQICKQ